MTGELHTDGPLVFTAQASGREIVMLGRVPVGEIGPVHDPRSKYPVCFRLYLPHIRSLSAWCPARDIDDARRQMRQQLNDWLNAADLRPNGH